MKPLKILAILSISSSLVACGPKPTVCISDPGKDNFRCRDYQKNVKLQHTLKEVDGWSCLSPVDFSNYLDACKRKMAGPLVNSCVVNFAKSEFRCFDQVKKELNQIPWVDTENYVCTSALDQDQLLTYCKTIKIK